MDVECYLIINPNRFPQYVKALKRIVKKYKFIKVIESKNLYHFLEAIGEYYKSKTPYLLIWGGDGTAHSAINRLTELRHEYKDDVIKRSIGFLRGGSGNGIQDSYEVPFSLFKQLKTYVNSMKKHLTIDVDLIKVEYNNRVEYTQLSGIGFDARILRIRDRYKRRIGRLKGFIKPGLWNYFVAIAKAVLYNYDQDLRCYSLVLKEGRYLYQGTRVNAEIKITEKIRDVRPLMVEVGNRPYFAALFKVCPDVVCNNGSMDLYIYNRMTRFSMIRYLIFFWRGWHSRINDRLVKKNRPVIEHYELKEMSIESDRPFHFHMDGDLKKVNISTNGNYRVNYRILPSSISFLVPEVFYNKFHPASLD